MTYIDELDCREEPMRGAAELRRRIEHIREYIRRVEGALSVHDSIMECALSEPGSFSAVAEAIYFSREALSGLKRINEVMESVGGEVSGLKWEISRMKSPCRTA